MEIFEKINGSFFKYGESKHIKCITGILGEIENKIIALDGVVKNEKAHGLLQSKLFQYLDEFLVLLSEKPELSQGLINKIKIFKSKLALFNELFDIAYQMPCEDLCWLDATHERWEAINKFITYHEPADMKAQKKDYKAFIKNIIIGQAFVSTGLQETNKFKRNLMIGLSAMYYFFFKSQATKKALLFYAEAELLTAKTTWNLLDSWLCTIIASPLLTSIEENTMIYVPRTAPHLTIDNIKTDLTEYSLIYTEDYVPIRVISPYQILNQENFRYGSSCCGRRDGKNGKKEKIKTDVIFHIHGGGFISMSSNSHQAYTRRWAKDLDLPVFSVDYRLAPRYPFPNGLEDVWQAYCWLISNIESLGISMNKIFVTGDSAGGNLSLALTYKAIITGTRVPDGLLLSYPAVNLDINTFNSSYLVALEDNILPHSFLKICLSSYLQDPGLDPTHNMLISPICASEEILEKLPPVRIVTGNADPLFDDCMKLLEKLVNLQVDVKCAVFTGVPHGALSFYVPGGVKEAKKFYKKTLGFFKELLYQPN